MKVRRETLVAVVALLALVAAACSSSPSSPSAPSLSSSDVQVLAKQFATAAVNGTKSGASQGTRSAGPLVPLAAAVRPQGISCNSSGSCQIFQQYTQTTNCTSGGRASVSGMITGSVTAGNLGPFGTISLQQTDSIVDWACMSGWTVNGDPYVSDTGTINFTGNHQSFSFHQSGGWVAVATAGGRTSCQENVAVSWESATNAGTLSGSVTCRPGGTFSVNGSF